MKLLFQHVKDQGSGLHDMGIIDTEEGEIHEVIDPNFEDFVAMEFSKYTTPDMNQPEELRRVYDGPYLIATPVDE
mgnify:CR=1 FL=1